MLRPFILALWCVLPLAAPAQVPPEASVTPLAPGAIEALPPVTDAFPQPFAGGLSASGEEVSGVGLQANVFSMDWPPPQSPPFRWSSGGGYELIAPPDSLGVIAIGGETRISGDGQVVVGAFTLVNPDPMLANMREHAFRWTSDEGATWLPVPKGGSSNVKAVSGDGSVSLGQVSFPAEGRRQVLWRDGDWIVIPPPEGDDRVYGRDLSGDGAVVVGTSFPSAATGFTRAAFRWTAETGSVRIPGLEGYSTSEANAISADGRFVVGYAYDGPLSNIEESVAFRWSEQDGLEILGRWRALDVSADGSVVVGTYRTAVAIIWTPEAGTRFAEDVFDADGWWLRHADAVSADGSIVLGRGETPSEVETSWRARMPRE